MRDPAFQSQQFADNVQARRENSIMNQGQTMQQGLASLPGLTQQAQARQQEMVLRDAESRSKLALQEVQRQAAQDDLVWAQQLHQTDMLALQKRMMEAQARGVEAETEMRIRQTEKMGVDTVREAVSVDRDAARAVGVDFEIVNGRPATKEVPPEQRSQADTNIKKRNMYRYNLEEMGYAGWTVDPKTFDPRPFTADEHAAFMERVKNKRTSESGNVAKFNALTKQKFAELETIDAQIRMEKSEPKKAELQKKRDNIQADIEHLGKTLLLGGEDGDGADSEAVGADPEAVPAPMTTQQKITEASKGLMQAIDALRAARRPAVTPGSNR